MWFRCRPACPQPPFLAHQCGQSLHGGGAWTGAICGGREAFTGMTTPKELPLASLIHERLTATVAKSREDADWAGFARELLESAGL